ncbi:hypothetical protein [Chlorobium sp.]
MNHAKQNNERNKQHGREIGSSDNPAYPASMIEILNTRNKDVNK